MKVSRRCALGCCAALSFLASGLGAKEAGKTRPPPPLPVLVFASGPVSEKEAPRPTPQNPAYYVPMAGGYHAEGPQMARDAADQVKWEEIGGPLQKMLAREGYLPATKATPPPTLLIVFHWGTMAPNLFESVFFNHKNMGNLVGATRVDRHLESEYGAMYSNATEPRYVIIVSAFDFAAATASKREKKLVWRTRLSVPALGTTLEEAIVPMITTGAPFFGRDSGQPKEIRWDRAKVEVGEARVIEEAAPEAKREEKTDPPPAQK